MPYAIFTIVEVKELIIREPSGICGLGCKFGCLLSYVVHEIVWGLQEITSEITRSLYQDRVVPFNDIWVKMVMKGTAVTPPHGPIAHEPKIPGPANPRHIVHN
jgi:hypothetical protein